MSSKSGDLSSTVKHLRKKAGITQEQLAEYSGVGLALVRKIEQGAPQCALIRLTVFSLSSTMNWPRFRSVTKRLKRKRVTRLHRRYAFPAGATVVFLSIEKYKAECLRGV